MSCLVGLCADRPKPIPADNLMHEISTNCARKSLHKLRKKSECIISSDEFVIRWIKQKTTNEFRHRISSRLHILVVFQVGQCSHQSDQVQSACVILSTVNAQLRVELFQGHKLNAADRFVNNRLVVVARRMRASKKQVCFAIINPNTNIRFYIAKISVAKCSGELQEFPVLEQECCRWKSRVNREHFIS